MVEPTFPGTFFGLHSFIPPLPRQPVATNAITVLIARSGPAGQRFLLPAEACDPLLSVASRNLAEVVPTRLAEDALALRSRDATLSLSSILASLWSSGREWTCAVERARRVR